MVPVEPLTLVLRVRPPAFLTFLFLRLVPVVVVMETLRVNVRDATAQMAVGAPVRLLERVWLAVLA